MRNLRKAQEANQILKNNAYFSITYALIMLAIFISFDIFNSLDFMGLGPFFFLLFSSLVIFKNKTKDISEKKESFPLTCIIMIGALCITNMPLFTMLSTFKAIKVLPVAELTATHKEAEGVIHINKYQTGSGRNAAYYTDIELLDQQGQPQFKIRCDFLKAKKGCTQLEKFEQQFSQIKYFSNPPYFSDQNVLLLNLKTTTEELSFAELMEQYQNQKYVGWFYLLVIILTNVFIIRIHILSYRYDKIFQQV